MLEGSAHATEVKLSLKKAHGRPSDGKPGEECIEQLGELLLRSGPRFLDLFVAEGLGVAVLDPLAMDYEPLPGVISRPFRPEILMDMAVVVSRTRPLSAIGAEFLDLLLERIDGVALNGIGTE